MQREDFEKDDDSNFHIDFIYSMANCRSLCYKLDEMDWITTKLKAGRIVPALATTTASIAGLQTLEMIKIISEFKRVDLKSHNLNLAVPVLTIQEPYEPPVNKLTEELKVTIWDRWNIKNFGKGTLQQMMTQIEDTYKGLEVIDVKMGNTDIYAQFFMNMNNNKALKKKTLASPLRDLTEMDDDDKYVDLTITMKRKEQKKDDKEAEEGKKEEMLPFVPPVRVYF